MKYVLIALSLFFLLGMKPQKSVSEQVNIAYAEIERLLSLKEIPDYIVSRLQELRKGVLIIAEQLKRPDEEELAFHYLKTVFSELEACKKEIPVPVKEGCTCTIL